MKTRKISAAVTAALLGFASVAAVASAATADVEYDADWTDIIAEEEGTTPGVSFKISKSDEKKLEGLTISASASTATISGTPAASDLNASGKDLEGLKDKVALNVATAIGDGKAAIYDISVVPEDDEDYGAREDFVLSAPIQLNVTGLDFKVDHVYHFDGDKLVEISPAKLTKKTVTLSGESSQSTLYGVQFKSKSFSAFVLSEGVIKGAVALDEQDTSSDDSSGTSSGAVAPGNANTGIALAIAPVLLAATAVSVVALKKKEK